jgi:uncharacterized protein with PIN domain
VEDEHEAMAAAKGQEAVTNVDREGKTALGDPIGGVQDRLEAEVMTISDEEAKEGRVAAVVYAEAAGEAGVRGEAAPAPGDGGGAGEGRGQRREAEDNL